VTRVSNRCLAGLLAIAIAAGLAPIAGAEEGAAPAKPAAEAGPMRFPIKQPEPQRWPFAGFFGSYDPAQLQRGFQVYKDVCSKCHSLKLVAFRSLAGQGGLGFTAAQVKALAAGYKVVDGPNETGEMFERPGRPSDRLPGPFANEQAAAAAYGAAPPDLSLMAKARGVARGPLFTALDFFTQYQEGGPDYIHALLTGFQDPPAGLKIPEGTYYNPYFNAAPSMKMPPPLTDGQIAYADGSPQTVDQYARDVAAFLMWAAEPTLIARKAMGFRVVIFLVIFAGLMLLTKRRVWSKVAH
jgi:ubiquinol-cytochrome c reductase cytochrome c1 subunit